MHKHIVIVALLFIGISCDQERIYHQYKTIEGIGWDSDQKHVFEIQGLDSIQPYNLFITLRNNHQYPYSNLFLITKMNFPNGKEVTDTLEYEMAEPDGNWLGSGFGDVKENKLWYKEDIRFRESGNYTFSITHAMRKNGNEKGDVILKGITDVGLRVESTSK